MGQNSHIQWTDHTFNPWTGCTKVAPECKNCYAELQEDYRYHRVKWGKGQPRHRTSESNWKQPVKWNAAATESGCRAKVFCASLSDWLDDEVPVEWLADLLRLVRRTNMLDWLLLTKRPGNWTERIQSARHVLLGRGDDDAAQWLEEWAEGVIDPPGNIWLGVSAGVNPSPLLEIPARVHFLSCEPMLQPLPEENVRGFDWIIFGGESGPHARPCDLAWIESGIELCRQMNIAPFVKQLGSKAVAHGQPLVREPGIGDIKRGDIGRWPEPLRHREFPR